MKDLACKRIQSRINPSYSNIDEYYKIRKSCHLVEVVETTMGTEYLCDCHFGIKGKLCKHSMGLVYLLEPSFEVAPTLNPLKFVGRKRGKGRPLPTIPSLISEQSGHIRCEYCNTIVSKKSFAKHKRSKLCLAHQGTIPAPVPSTCLPLTCPPPSTKRKRDVSIPRRVLRHKNLMLWNNLL